MIWDNLRREPMNHKIVKNFTKRLNAYFAKTGDRHSEYIQSDWQAVYYYYRPTVRMTISFAAQIISCNTRNDYMLLQKKSNIFT